MEWKPGSTYNPLPASSLTHARELAVQAGRKIVASLPDGRRLTMWPDGRSVTHYYRVKPIQPEPNKLSQQEKWDREEEARAELRMSRRVGELPAVEPTPEEIAEHAYRESPEFHPWDRPEPDISDPQDRCYACNRRLTSPRVAFTGDGQRQYVGPECSAKVKRAGFDGWQPPLGGPRLYAVPVCTCADGACLRHPALTV